MLTKTGLFLSLLMVATSCVTMDNARLKAENYHGAMVFGSGLIVGPMAAGNAVNCFYLCKNFKPTAQEESAARTTKNITDQAVQLTKNDFPRYRRYKHWGMMFGATYLLSFGFMCYHMNKGLNYGLSNKPPVFPTNTSAA